MEDEKILFYGIIQIDKIIDKIIIKYIYGGWQNSFLWYNSNW